jgi:hypothetical protein
MRLRVWKVIFWLGVILLAALIGGVWFAYRHVTDSARLVAEIEREAPRYLRGRLELGRARWVPLVGHISLSQIFLWQKMDGLDHLAARIPWLLIRHDTAALAQGRFIPREVVAVQPTFRLRRRKGGTWNVEGLLAGPWPVPVSAPSPTFLIQDGKIELCDGDGPSFALLREVALRIEPTARNGPLRFEGSARSDAFDYFKFAGTFDLGTRRLTLTSGDLTKLIISETWQRWLPAEWRPSAKRVGLTAGEIDLTLKTLTYDPSASPPLHYEASAQLRGGTWSCPKLPFPLNDLTAQASVRDGVLTIARAEGYNGRTTVRLRRGGTVDLTHPEQGPFHLTIEVADLEIDDRLRAWTPPEFVDFWKDFRPRGRISLALTVVRERAGGPIGFGMGVECLDVAMTFRHFAYPLEHLRGTLTWEGERITVDVRALLGGKPARAYGTIDRPGPNAIVDLMFQAESLPIDKTLLDALPRDYRDVVDDFQPTGSVRGQAHMSRTPPGPGDPPEGKVLIDASLDLNEGCSITWEGLPYRIADLTGHLDLHPTSWAFRRMSGRNGLASIHGEGDVHQLGGPNRLKVDLHLWAQHLSFDDQLRTALPTAWKKTWATLRPSGSSTVDARIKGELGKEHYSITIIPEAETRVELRLPRIPGPGVAPGETFDMPPMERVAGTFVFDDGTVRMVDVCFQFRGSPAHFAKGQVIVKDTGQFRLDVKDLEVADFRVDNDLRRIMPPVMAQFARRLDEGRTFRLRADMAIGWEGQPGTSAWCRWKNALVVFNGNTIQTGLPLEHLQGQIDHLRGQFDGRALEVHGLLNFDSISLLGQQVTRLTSSLDVVHDRAILSTIHGVLLGGEIVGKVEVDLAATPRYEANLTLRGADLQQYTKTLPGRQNLRGLIDAQLAINGLGNDLHTVQGRGWARITQGDLGELPAYLRLVKVINLSRMTKTAFDSAQTTFTIQNGETHFNPILLTGDAFSLHGQGTLSAQGELDLKLRILFGRDRFHIPVLSDAWREASGPILLVRVQGTPAYPKYRLVPLQPVSNSFRSLGTDLRRIARSRRAAGSVGFGQNTAGSSLE